MGGAIITWFDFRTGSDADIYTQRINSSGVVQWTADGVAICTASGDQENQTIIGSNSGSAIITWDDFRNGTDYNIYASKVSSGTLFPVEITTFVANNIGDKVELNWETATEVNNYGFEVERLQNSKIAGLQNWEKIGFVKGYGNSNSLKEYSFVDNNSLSGKVDYRLKQIDNDSEFKYSNIVEVSLS